MTATAERRVALIVYHPKAGRSTQFDLDRILGTAVRRLCEEGGFRAEVRPLPRTHLSATDVAYADVVVAMGGDGTVRRVLGAVAASGRRPLAGIIPTGTGNMLARHLGLFGRGVGDPIENAIDVIIHGETIGIDLGMMNGEYFVIDAGAGPISNAIIVPRPRHKSRFKMLVYIEPLLRSLTKRPGVFRVTADGQETIVSASGIFVSNAPEMGIGQRNVEQLSDGTLELCILSPRTSGDYWRLAIKLLRWLVTGGAAHEPPYRISPVREVTIETVPLLRPPSFSERLRARLQKVFLGRSLRPDQHQGELPAMVDGDRCGCTPMLVKVIPQAVQLRVPPSVVQPADARLARHGDLQPGERTS